MTFAGVGSRLGRYEIIAEIGQGGMSVVYRARDLQLQRDVAIKIMHAFLAEQREARERFRREAIAVARLRHPHIIQIFDYSDAEMDSTYIVTELVEGRPLAERLVEGAIGPPEAGLILARPIADALHAAHEAGVIHRDLKPENILVGASGVLKLTDFGIARILDNQTLTVTGTLLGSPAYMAPEYIEGQATDARADIFSFGAMLYQMTVGRLPFTGPSPHALLKRIAAGQYTPAAQANPRIHAAIARIIQRAMALQPDDRYPDAASMLKDIDAILAPLGLDAPETHVAWLADPAGYNKALETRLTGQYVALGQLALKQGQTGRALEHFDRVLTLQPDHKEVRQMLRRLARRSLAFNLLRAGATAATLVGLAAFGWQLWAHRAIAPRPPSPAIAAAPALNNPNTPPTSRPNRRRVSFSLQGIGDLYVDNHLLRRAITGIYGEELDDGPHTARFVGTARTDARAFIVDANSQSTPVRLNAHSPPPQPAPAVAPSRPATPTANNNTLTQAAAAPRRDVEFKPAGQWVTLFVDDNPTPVVKEEMRTFVVSLPYGKHKLRFTNDKAQPFEESINVSDTEPLHAQLIRLHPLDARLRIRNAPDGAVVEVAQRRFVLNEHTRGDPIFVPLPEGQGVKEYEVVVHSPDGAQEFFRERVLFRPGEEQTLAIVAKPL